MLNSKALFFKSLVLMITSLNVFGSEDEGSCSPKSIASMPDKKRAITDYFPTLSIVCEQTSGIKSSLQNLSIAPNASDKENKTPNSGKRLKLSLPVAVSEEATSSVALIAPVSVAPEDEIEKIFGLNPVVHFDEDKCSVDIFANNSTSYHEQFANYTTREEMEIWVGKKAKGKDYIIFRSKKENCGNWGYN